MFWELPDCENERIKPGKVFLEKFRIEFKTYFIAAS